MLRQVVTSVRCVVRDYDLVIRYGGDEFVCGLLDLTLDDAANRFANTRKDLATWRSRSDWPSSESTTPCRT